MVYNSPLLPGCSNPVSNLGLGHCVDCFLGDIHFSQCQWLFTKQVLLVFFSVLESTW